MSDTNNTETAGEPEVELSAQDIADLASLGSTESKPRTLLEVWSNVLKNIEPSRDQKHIAPTIANKIVSSWPKMSFQDVRNYHLKYHALLIELRDILENLIEKNPDALENTENEAVDNRDLYIELVSRWHEQVAQWERDWTVDDADSHVQLAAIADAASFFTGPSGLAAHFSDIGLSFTDDDRETLTKRLMLAAEEVEGE